MGHGWEETGRICEASRRKCELGDGFIVSYGHEEESDFPPFTRCEPEWEECQCKDMTCKSRRERR